MNVCSRSSLAWVSGADDVPSTVESTVGQEHRTAHITVSIDCTYDQTSELYNASNLLQYMHC